VTKAAHDIGTNSADFIAEQVRKLARGEGDPSILLADAASLLWRMCSDYDFDRKADGAKAVTVIGKGLKSFSCDERISLILKRELNEYFGAPWWQPGFFDSGHLNYPPNEHYWALLVSALEQVASRSSTPPELQEIMCGILRHAGETARIWSGEWLAIQKEPHVDPEYTTQAAEAVVADPLTPPAGKAAAWYILARSAGPRQDEAYVGLAETVISPESSSWVKAKCRRYLIEISPEVESEAMEHAFLCLIDQSSDPDDHGCGQALFPEVFREDRLEDYSDEMLSLLYDQIETGAPDETESEREQRLRSAQPNWEWRLDRAIESRAVFRPDSVWYEAEHQRVREVTSSRAEAIARARVASESFACDVYEELPACYSVYWVGPPPKDCWYVICGPVQPLMLGGSRSLVCISKQSGRVLLVTSVSSD
jgi:hypothetical protein